MKWCARHCRNFERIFARSWAILFPKGEDVREENRAFDDACVRGAGAFRLCGAEHGEGRACDAAAAEYGGCAG